MANKTKTVHYYLGSSNGFLEHGDILFRAAEQLAKKDKVFYGGKPSPGVWYKEFLEREAIKQAKQGEDYFNATPYTPFEAFEDTRKIVNASCPPDVAEPLLADMLKIFDRLVSDG